MTTTRPLTALRAARLFDGECLVDDPLVVLDGGHLGDRGYLSLVSYRATSWVTVPAVP